METKRVSPPSTTTFTTKLARTTSGSGSGSGTIILNKYQLGRLLGRGSFAKVYHGRCLDDNSAVAIKAIDKNKDFQAPLEQLIIREVSVMRRLNHHPSILKIHEVMATKTKIYLVMELAPGGELFAKLQQRGKFYESTARNYFHQLISALHFCHQNGVAHRDIKPQNMLLDKQGNLKISDFGLSAMPEQLKNGMLHTACGTPAYTAPEVVYRKGYDGSKADAWSCGVLLYVFIVGSLPFDDANLSQMYRAMHRRIFDFPEWVSKPAKSIIYRLLDPNPTTRLGIEELMKLSWFKKSSRSSFKEQEFGTVFGQKDKDSGYLSRMNAFDIISMSSGLNLSGLFERGLSRKEMRFTSGSKVGEIEERVVKVGGELGYRVERGKGRGIGLEKGCGVLVVEIWEVAEGLWMVEFKVVEGRVMEFEESHWEELKAGLKDIALSSHNEYDGSGVV